MVGGVQSYWQANKTALEEGGVLGKVVVRYSGEGLWVRVVCGEGCLW